MKSVFLFLLSAIAVTAADIRVVVWDEQQPRQKAAYENFLGNAIANHLKTKPGLKVRSVRQNDPNKGIGADVLGNCDVLIWWGHVRQGQITPTDCKPIIDRIQAGELAFLPLHSAHWATPFMEAMNARTREDVARLFPRNAKSPNLKVEYVAPTGRIPPARNSLVTPAYLALQRRGVVTTVRVDLPNCCFPAYRGDGKPSTMHTLLPEHPIAKGLPKTWTIAKTEMYDEPFHVPQPDQVVFKETFAGGEWFRSGSVWNLGKGKVFYFRPGHETYPVFKEKFPLLVIENAVRWLAAELPKEK